VAEADFTIHESDGYYIASPCDEHEGCYLLYVVQGSAHGRYHFVPAEIDAMNARLMAALDEGKAEVAADRERWPRNGHGEPHW
jgi:hypothetical protein